MPEGLCRPDVLHLADMLIVVGAAQGLRTNFNPAGAVVLVRLDQVSAFGLMVLRHATALGNVTKTGRLLGPEQVLLFRLEVAVLAPAVVLMPFDDRPLLAVKVSRTPDNADGATGKASPLNAKCIQIAPLCDIDVPDLPGVVDDAGSLAAPEPGALRLVLDPKAVSLTAVLFQLFALLAFFLLRDVSLGLTAFRVMRGRLLLARGLRRLGMALLLGPRIADLAVLRLSRELLVEVLPMTLQAALLRPFPGESVTLFRGFDRFGLPLLVGLIALGRAALLGLRLFGLLPRLLRQAVGATERSASLRV